MPCESVLNLCIPDALVVVVRPIVLIPDIASESLLKSLIVDVFTNFATYSSPLTRVPGVPPSTTVIGSFPF